MNGGIAGLLGGISGPSDAGFLMGTVQALTPPAATVLLDGSDTTVTATTTKVATAIAVGDRVLCARIGQSVYVLTNLTGFPTGVAIVPGTVLSAAWPNTYPIGQSFAITPNSASPDTNYPGGHVGILETMRYHPSGYVTQTFTDVGASTGWLTGSQWVRGGYVGTTGSLGWNGAGWVPATALNPLAIAYQTSAQTVVTSTQTQVTFQQAPRDNFAGWTNSPVDTYTVIRPGVYTITGQISWAAATTGIRQTAIRVNNVEQIVHKENAASAGAHFGVTAVGDLVLAANDLITMWAFHTQGANLATNPSATSKGWVSLSVKWIGD